jgi:hypothetical protein
MDSSAFVDPNSVQSHYNMTSSNHLFAGPKMSGPVSNIRDKDANAYAATAYKSTPVGGHIFEETIRTDLIGHIHYPTPLNQVFFSQANIDKLQSDIQDQVHRMSAGKYRIDKQDEQQLKLIMRSYYLMYAKNDGAVAEDLADLNARVVGYASAKVYSEVDFHQFYVQDLEVFPAPIANPMNVGVYGTRTGELKSFF